MDFKEALEKAIYIVSTPNVSYRTPFKGGDSIFYILPNRRLGAKIQIENYHDFEDIRDEMTTACFKCPRSLVFEFPSTQTIATVPEGFVKQGNSLWYGKLLTYLRYDVKTEGGWIKTKVCRMIDSFSSFRELADKVNNLNQTFHFVGYYDSIDTTVYYEEDYSKLSKYWSDAIVFIFATEPEALN